MPPVVQPTVPVPAECLKAALAATPALLSRLPGGYLLLAPDAQARALLSNKAADAQAYGTLRAVAIRCAPEK